MYSDFTIQSLTLTTVNNLSDPLPSALAEALQQDFTSPPPKADTAALLAYNDKFLKEHSDSVSHLLRGYNVRFRLDPKTKTQNEKDLQVLLDSNNTSIEQAIDGAKLLVEWKSEDSVMAAYRKTAGKRWPYVTFFQQQ
jgi:N-alpha-acetyltransferase 15/16, NatA auxiliary subunit